MNELLKSNKGFRNFLMFQAFYGIGNGIFGIFMMWFVHAQFRNPIYTGIAGALFVAPNMLCFFVGPFVDRYNKIKLLRIACLVNILIVGGLLGAAHLGLHNIWIYQILIFIFSLTGMLGRPAATALLPIIVKDDELIKANALISIIGIIGGIGIGVVLYYLVGNGAGVELVYSVNFGVLIIAFVFSAFVKSNEK